VPTNLESTFGDYSVPNQAMKIKFSRVIIVGGETDRKCLLRPEWYQELRKPNCRKVAVASPLKQSIEHFI
jgi:hypothetical protein